MGEEKKLHLDKLRKEVKDVLFIHANDRGILLEVQKNMMLRGIPSGTVAKMFSQEISIDDITEDMLYHLARTLFLSLKNNMMLDTNKYYEKQEIEKYSRHKYKEKV